MRLRRKFLTLSLLAFLCILWNVPFAVKAQAPIQVTATADINLRSGPQSNAKVISVIPTGTTPTATGRNKATSWLQVTFNSSTGWVSVRFVTTSGDLKTLPIVDNVAAPPPATGGSGGSPGGAVTGTVGSNGLSIREQPSASSKKLGQLSSGAVVTLTGRRGSSNGLWVRFSYQGQDAWLAGWLLKISGDVNSLPDVAPAPAPAPTQPPTNPPAKGQATLVFVNQLATTLHIKAQGPTPIDVNMGPNATLTFSVTPGNYHLEASAQEREGVGHDVTLAAGQTFTWYLHG